MGVDPYFPLFLWDKLLLQTALALNLIKQSNVTPNVSAYAYLHGPFDCNAMLQAPLGSAVQA